MSLRSGNSRSTASVTARAPGGIVKDGFSPKVRARSVPGMIADFSFRTAIWTAVSVRGLVPYRFENRTRTRLPPILVGTIIRIVWFSTSRSTWIPGGAKPDVWDAAAHVATQGVG